MFTSLVKCLGVSNCVLLTEATTGKGNANFLPKENVVRERPLGTKSGWNDVL